MLLAFSAGASFTEAQENPSDQNAASEEAQLLDQLDESGAVVQRNSETGEVGFIGTTKNAAIDRPPGLAANAPPVAAARAHLARFGELFGIEDQARELRAEETDEVGGGRSVVSFQQLHKGVPVLAGELNVQVDGDNELLVANGEALADVSLDVQPAVVAQEAERTAIGKVAKDYGIEPSELRATEPALWIYDPALLGGPGMPVSRLVWRMDVSPEGLSDINELVLVDAEEGNVALNFNQVAHAKNRFVCDRNNVAGANPNCLSSTDGYARTEGQPATGIADVDKAYDHAGDVYDFYQSKFGRDSINGAGMAIRSTVRWCPDSFNCPLNNAFWNGAKGQMMYGNGHVDDDTVGHELTHGVTDYESNLYNYYQSGAINESLSDIFGEFVDLGNGRGNDDPSVRWLAGEDSPGGASRNIKDPTLSSSIAQPDRMLSPNYWVSEQDKGGVHINNGVGNKSAYLITDGDTFNGKTVTGLGIDKAARIYYEVNTNLLTSASDYKDLYAALPQACRNLIGTAGITSADCQEVQDAVDATQMNLISAAAAPNPEAPVCKRGQRMRTLFFDNLENLASGNWLAPRFVGTTSWVYWTGIFGYAASGKVSMFGEDAPTRSDFAAQMSRSVQVPTGKTTYLRFNHAYGFEDSLGNYYDGGVIEYSTNNGSTWRDIGATRFTHNGYDGTLKSGFGNPLGGRKGFGGESKGYSSSRVNLSSLAGKNVRFRFRVGNDSTGSDYGWWVDDVRVYTCS